MKSVPKDQQESYKNAKICYIFKDEFEDKQAKDKKYFKVRDHCHIMQINIELLNICNLKFSVPK